MSTRQKKNRKLPGILFPAICLLLSAYFLNHAVSGRHGLSSYQDAKADALQLEFRLAELREEKEVLAHRVSLLKSGSIEKDMLDEQARYHLNLVHQNEIVIMK